MIAFGRKWTEREGSNGNRISDIETTKKQHVQHASKEWSVVDTVYRLRYRVWPRRLLEIRP